MQNSPVSAGVGDVYYCEPKEFIELKNFKTTKYKNQTFSFIRSAYGLIFKGGYMDDFRLLRKIADNGTTEQITWSNDWPNNTIWHLNGEVYTLVFATFDRVTAQQGTCSMDGW